MTSVPSAIFINGWIAACSLTALISFALMVFGFWTGRKRSAWASLSLHGLTLIPGRLHPANCNLADIVFLFWPNRPDQVVSATATPISENGGNVTSEPCILCMMTRVSYASRAKCSVYRVRLRNWTPQQSGEVDSIGAGPILISS